MYEYAILTELSPCHEYVSFHRLPGMEGCCNPSLCILHCPSHIRLRRIILRHFPALLRFHARPRAIQVTIAGELHASAFYHTLPYPCICRELLGILISVSWLKVNQLCMNTTEQTQRYVSSLPQTRPIRATFIALAMLISMKVVAGRSEHKYRRGRSWLVNGMIAADRVIETNSVHLMLRQSTDSLQLHFLKCTFGVMSGMYREPVWLDAVGAAIKERRQ